jgi:type IV pilus assembly protein PilC
LSGADLSAVVVGYHYRCRDPRFVIPVFSVQEFDPPSGAYPAVDMSRFLKSPLSHLAFGVLSMPCLRRTTSGKKQIDTLLLKLPIFGDLLKKTAVARFTRTLGTMIGSGVPILDALDIVARTAGNVVIEEIIYEVRSSIAEGQTIAEPLKMMFSHTIQMISVGEATGALDTMLEKIADFYDDEVDAAVAALTSMLEPLLMLFLGGAIGGLVIAMYLPIFGMAAAMGS